MVNQTCLTWATSWPCPALLTCGQTGPQAVTPSLCSPLSRGDLKGPAGDRPHSVVTWGGGPLNAVVHSGHALPAQPPLQPPGLRRDSLSPQERPREQRQLGLLGSGMHPTRPAWPAPHLLCRGSAPERPDPCPSTSPASCSANVPPFSQSSLVDWARQVGARSPGQRPLGAQSRKP